MTVSSGLARPHQTIRSAAETGGMTKACNRRLDPLKRERARSNTGRSRRGGAQKARATARAAAEAVHTIGPGG